jgi:hypothetical protein
VHNSAEGPVQGATVTGSWSGGGGGGTSCTTNASGNCTVLRFLIPANQASNTFTVTGVTGANASGAYNAANNHDPDVGAQASTGTVIVVPRVNGAGLAAIAPATLRPAAIGGANVTGRGLTITGLNGRVRQQ